MAILLAVLFDIFDVDQDGLLSEVEIVHLMKDQCEFRSVAAAELMSRMCVKMFISVVHGYVRPPHLI